MRGRDKAFFFNPNILHKGCHKVFIYSYLYSFFKDINIITNVLVCVEWLFLYQPCVQVVSKNFKKVKNDPISCA